MSALPKACVIGHRTWKIRPYPPAKADKAREDGSCIYATTTILVRTDKRSGVQRANILLHEIEHAIWDEAGLAEGDSEEKIVSAVSNIRMQVFRDNPDVIDWISEKARS